MLERQKILEIAKTLFNENGYFNVTMRQISNHLGISVGNLTYYYPKKADILRGIMAQSLHDVLVPNFYDLTTLNDYFGVLIDSLENERFFFLDYYRLHSLHPENKTNELLVKDKLFQGVNQLIANGLFIDSVSDVTVESLIKIFMMADLAWIKQPNRNREEFLKLHWNVLYAFLTEKGVKKLKTFLS